MDLGLRHPLGQPEISPQGLEDRVVRYRRAIGDAGRLDDIRFLERVDELVQEA